MTATSPEVARWMAEHARHLIMDGRCGIEQLQIHCLNHQRKYQKYRPDGRVHEQLQRCIGGDEPCKYWEADRDETPATTAHSRTDGLTKAGMEMCKKATEARRRARRKEWK